MSSSPRSRASKTLRKKAPGPRPPGKAAPSAAPLDSGAELEGLRERINALDAQLVGVINQRAEVARVIGKLKADQGLKAYAPSRERQVYERVRALNRGPLSDTGFLAIYREIMSATLALERPTRVCHFGSPGSFTHLAARTKFGASVEYLAARDSRDVFVAVNRGTADYGVIPIENSTEGGVNQSIDLLAENRLKICSEIYLPIHQNLLSHAKLKEIRVIYSHPQAFAQCRNWLEGHLGFADRKEVGSTAEAAERAAKERSAGAIAGRLAAELHGVPLVAENIEDQQDNITRFVVLSETIAEPCGKDKTSLLIVVGDAPGALLKVLQPFQDHKINLNRIESRPSRRRPWEYHFFIDLEGHQRDPEVERTLREIEARCRHLQILGSYPAANRLSDQLVDRAG